MVLWPVPYRLSKRCFVSASFTAMIGKRSAPSRAMARSLITPVVVSSVPAITCIEQLAPALVQLRDEICAVVHGHLRLRIEHSLDMRVVARGVLALDGEGRDPVLARKRGRNGVLRGERIARAEADVGAARLQRDREVCRLAGDVKARAETQTLERPLTRESLTDDAAGPASRAPPNR